MRGGGARLRWAADALTLVRVLLSVPFAMAVCVDADHALVGLFVIAAASDVVDGRLARRYGTASERGRWLDHLCDIVFLLVAYVSLWSVGDVVVFVPVAIFLSFGYYVLSSMRLSDAGGNLVGSRLGHASGVLNWVVLGTIVFDLALGRVLPAVLVTLSMWAVVVASVVAMVARWQGGQAWVSG